MQFIKIMNCRNKKTVKQWGKKGINLKFKNYLRSGKHE